MEQTKKNFIDFSSSTLHLIAMTTMLLDHMWATLFMHQEWMTCVGRIAFPIFAFMIVEGYFHTHNLKKYVLRMLGFAVISEIPFDLVYSGQWFYPFHQNVLWTFLIAIAGIWCMEKFRSKNKKWLMVLGDIWMVLLGFMLGMILMTDFYGTGVLTVFVFYFFRQKKWWSYLGQVIVLYWINVELLGGYYYPIQIFGMEFELIQQGIALLALIPIWLYHGRKGIKSKVFQYGCYAFYPVHLLILGLLMLR